VKKPNRLIYYDGLKSSLLWDETTDAWHYLSGAPETDTQKMYGLVPTLFRGVTMIANAVGTMPFEIYGKGDKAIDTSADYKNELGFLPNPRRLFSLVSMSLDLAGRAYVKPLSNKANIQKELRYFAPQSITPKFDKDKGALVGFERDRGGAQPDLLKPEELIYWWLPDPFVEIGPPKAWPAQDALSACGVLSNLATFVSLYFQRGAIRPMLVYAKGSPGQPERERMEAWFNKIFNGIRGAFKARVFNADTVETKVIGDGLDQLRDVELTNQNRQDIAHALGIPYALLFSEAANNATLQGDTLNFYQGTVEPRCEFIASVMNEQLLDPMGYHLEYLPETLDVYQEDEADRALALGQMVTALGDPELIADKAKRRDQMAEIAAQAPKPPEPGQQPEQTANPVPPQFQANQQQGQEEKRRLELDRWQRRVINDFEKGRPLADYEFTSDIIPPVTRAAIRGALESCKNLRDIKQVFRSIWIGYP
jgi:HK97 family phage portal protein